MLFARWWARLQQHRGGRWLLRVLRGNLLWVLFAIGAAVYGVQHYFSQSRVSQAPLPRAVLSDQRETELEKHLKAREALHVQRQDESAVKALQKQLETQEGLIKTLKVGLEKAENGGQKRTEDEAALLKRVTTAAEAAARKVVQDSKGSGKQEKQEKQGARGESPKRSPAELVAAAPLPVPKPKLRILTSDRSETFVPPPAYRGEVARILPMCFARGRVVTGVAASSRAASKLPMALGISEELHCPQQLLGPGRDPRPTALPVQGCMLHAEAVGDLASSRVHGQLRLLACVMTDGSAFEEPVEGYITDSDGKYGVVGTIETHASAQEFKIFLTSMLQEASAAVGLARSKFVVTSVSGASQPFKGVETGMDKLINLYLQQMEYLLPTLEVESDQPIWVVFTKGVSIPGLPTSLLLSRGQ